MNKNERFNNIPHASLGMRSHNKVAYLCEAVRDESKRLGFLSVLISDPIPYCSGIRYDPDGSSARDWLVNQVREMGASENVAKKLDEGLMASRLQNPTAGLPLVSYLLGSGINPPLFVGRGLFSGKYNKEEISHILRVHEGTHLRQVSCGFPYFDTTEFRDAWINKQIRPVTAANIAEIDANHQSLLSLQRGEFQVRDQYVQKLLNHYKSGIVNLYNLFEDSVSEVERNSIEKTLNAVPHRKIGA
jgi:hypothetical protein